MALVVRRWSGERREVPIEQHAGSNELHYSFQYHSRFGPESMIYVVLVGVEVVVELHPTSTEPRLHHSSHSLPPPALCRYHGDYFLPANIAQRPPARGGAFRCNSPLLPPFSPSPPLLAHNLTNPQLSHSPASWTGSSPPLPTPSPLSATACTNAPPSWRPQIPAQPWRSPPFAAKR